MQKKLPKIYQSAFSHEITNNHRVYYSANPENQIRTGKEPSRNLNGSMEKEEVEKAIYDLFHTTGYVFNIPVEIKTQDQSYNTKIAGRIQQTLVTLDDKRIPISSIVSIKRKDR